MKFRDVTQLQVTEIPLSSTVLLLCSLFGNSAQINLKVEKFALVKNFAHYTLKMAAFGNGE